MLDITYIRDHADDLKKAITNKQLNPKIVDEVIATDEQRRKYIVEVEKIRQEMNLNVSEIKNSTDKKPSPDQIQKGRDLKVKLQDVEPQLKKTEEIFRDLMLQVANPPATDVPVGKDEHGNQVTKKVGEPTQFS